MGSRSPSSGDTRLAGVSISHNGGNHLAAILGNPVMIDAYQGGHSRQRQAFPGRRQDGEDPLEPEKDGDVPGPPTVPGTQHDVDFMVKDSKRFADSGGWGYGVFEYDAASDTFSPAPWLTSRRRGTTPSAGSRATRR
jgi:hypothetical protein